MELYEIQFRKSRLDIQKEKEVAVLKAIATKLEALEEQLHNKAVKGYERCKFCDLDIFWVKGSNGKGVATDPHSYLQIDDYGEPVAHRCVRWSYCKKI